MPRPVWIVEATPKNPYHLFGKQVLYFDKDTCRGYWKNKYDWKGDAMVNWAVAALPITKVKTRDGRDFYLRTGGGNAAYAVNYKMDRATRGPLVFGHAGAVGGYRAGMKPAHRGDVR